MNQLNPEQRFLTSAHAADHQKWARSEASRAAIEATLASMAVDAKADALLKLEGAVSFAKLLIEIAEPKQERKPVESSTLKYQ